MRCFILKGNDHFFVMSLPVYQVRNYQGSTEVMLKASMIYHKYKAMFLAGEGDSDDGSTAHSTVDGGSKKKGISSQNERRGEPGL